MKILSFKCRLACIIFNILINVCQVFSQTYKTNNVSLSKSKTSLNLRCVPFCSVKILDNRFDTSRRIYSYETGQYPLSYIYFDQSAANEAKNYINKTIAHVPRGKDTLLINITEWNIPNYGVWINENRSSKRPNRRKRYSRDFIRFTAELFFQVGVKKFQKFATVKLYHFMSPLNGLDPDPIRMLLDELIGCATFRNDSCAREDGLTKRKRLEWYRDSTRIVYEKPMPELDISEINISAIQRWSKLPAFNISEKETGVFKTFEDFRENKLTGYSVALNFDFHDSLYHIQTNDSSTPRLSNSWGIIVSGKIYFKIGNNCFIPLIKDNNLFKFYVPLSFPDMYTLLSLREHSRINDVSSAKTENILADMGSILITGIANEFVKKHVIKNTMDNVDKHSFRECCIDMDSGDIIYQ